MLLRHEITRTHKITLKHTGSPNKPTVFSSDKLKHLMAHTSKQKPDISKKTIDFLYFLFLVPALGVFHAKKRNFRKFSPERNCQKKKKKCRSKKDGGRKKWNPSP